MKTKGKLLLENMNEIQEAIKVLKKGGVIIFPTDTAFGIGCRIDSEKAIERLFKIRNRPENMAVPVLVSSLEMVKDYVQKIPIEVEKQLIKKYWPGALTIVLKCKKKLVPSLVRGGGKTLGVRIPNYAVILEIIKGVGVGILGSSANFHGEKTPYEFSDLNKELVKLVDFVVSGETTVKKQSTVIDTSKKPWTILRLGSVDIKPELLL